MDRRQTQPAWIYLLLVFIFSSSRSSAYFGLTGKAQIRDVKDIDQEAVYMGEGEQDSVYLWNENGYYTAPSNGYERIDLSPQPDSETRPRGSRSKKNAGTKKPDPSDQRLLKSDTTLEGKTAFTFDSVQPNTRHSGPDIPSIPQVRPHPSYQRRDAGPRPGYSTSLTRVPRYPRTRPIPVQHMRYRPSTYQYQRDGTGIRISPPFKAHFPNGPPYPIDNQPPRQAISGRVQSLDFDTLVARRGRYPGIRYYPSARVTSDRTGSQQNVGGVPPWHSIQNDKAMRDQSSADVNGLDFRLRREGLGPSLADRKPDSPTRRDENGGTAETEQPSVTGDSTFGPGEIKPLFVTKDIPAIMSFMGVDEKGQPYVKVDEEIDPSSLSATDISNAGSRATDLPPMVPSSEINKKDARRDCDELKLTRKQRKLCKRDPGLPQVLREATATSVAECQYQFRFERWNCSTGNTRIHLLSKGNRETAFLFAISSAGLTHSIARACAEGYLERCSCDETYSDHVNQEAWMWGGCGDNIHAAAKFVRRFLRPKSRSRDIRAEVDKHNSDLGIRTVRQSVEKTCKCHGVSGSCTTKTCWRKVAPFYEIGEKIKAAYNKSVKVASVNSADGKPKLIRLRRTRRNRPEIRPSPVDLENQTMPWATLATSYHEAEALEGDFPGHLSNVSDRFGRPGLLRVEHRRFDVNLRSNELVYLENSPQYCKRTRFSLGTKGRLCDKERNCEKICCGRGYTTQVRIVHRSCQCEVRWCCYVECKTCTERREVHTCK